MRETLKDPLRLEHIIDSIDRLMQAQQRLDFKMLSEKDLEYFGIVKLLEIIGEAAYKLTVPPLRAQISNYLNEFED